MTISVLLVSSPPCPNTPSHPAPLLSPSQVGFRKGVMPLLSHLGSRTQLELVLCAISLFLAMLLAGSMITLGVQYNKGRRRVCGVLYAAPLLSTGN